MTRIERELRDVVSRVTPGAQLSDIVRSEPWGPYDNPKLSGGKGDGIVDYETYGIKATVTVGGRKGSLIISLSRKLDGRDRRVFGCEGYRDSKCQQTKTPEGRFLLTNSQRVPAEFDPNPDISYQVHADRGNDVWVWVDHENGVDTGPNSDASPLTLAQLKQIALDPALVPEL